MVIVGSTLLVLGAGVVGLSCAWRAADAGWSVTVVDPAPASGASWVAGGMLAPVTEAWPGEESLLALGDAALRRWPGFAAELGVAGGPPGLRAEGTVVAATGVGDRAELDTLAAHLARLGRPVERLSGRQLRRLEPSIGPDVRGGLSVPTDLAVDNRMLLHAMRSAAEKAGVRFRSRTVAKVLDDGVRVVGVRLADPWSTPARVGRSGSASRAIRQCESAERSAGTATTVRADAVLVSAGAHSAALHPVLEGLVRPVKGEILRLAHRPGALPPPRHTVRALVDGRPVYVVPRGAGAEHQASGRVPLPGHAADDLAAGRAGVVVGATQQETGFDAEPTVAGVRDLLRDAERVLPGLAEYALVEAAAGLRPGSPDNAPIVGALGPEGLVVATGHGRNGILLAPVTADAVVAVLRGEPLPEELSAADPRRFGRGAGPGRGIARNVDDADEEVTHVRVDQW